jgi:hypothetical protein
MGWDSALACRTTELAGRTATQKDRHSIRSWKKIFYPLRGWKKIFYPSASVPGPGVEVARDGRCRGQQGGSTVQVAAVPPVYRNIEVGVDEAPVTVF